ncbi:MAG: alternative ribosome rescue aminoacyl-tRNA hydrolase ArfB [Janthinobacterium lividum]
MIKVSPTLSIDDDEIRESFVKASGSGGQKVNKTSSAVELRFDARRSPSLSDPVAARLMRLAGSRLTLDGEIVIFAQVHRSQLRNREDALARLLALIAEAEVAPVRRRKTGISKGAKQRRLESKGARSSVKASRSRPVSE